ncbi:MAG: CoA transferase [Chloroflexota bacterium]
MADGAVLSGVRILDFSRVLAGPYATRLLADFGAEVIRVQPLLPAESSDRFARGYENTWNRNKLGITLDLDKEAGRDLARRLVVVSDAVVENFTPRVMANWGLDYPRLREVKPEIIMVSLSLMGQTGPWRDYAGFGPTVHAFSGLTALTAFPGGPPVGPGFAYADHVAGLFASLALTGALEQRRRTGKGQHVDLAEVEAVVSVLGGAVADCSRSGREPVTQGNRSPAAAPRDVYRCRGRDRWCAVSVPDETAWRGLKAALGRPAWAEEARFATPEARQENQEELDGLISAWTATRTAVQVMRTLRRHGVPAGVVQSAADLARDPHLKARGFFVSLPHPGLGETVADASPLRFSRTPAAYRRAAPLPGQDNDAVFRGLLGLTKAETAALRRQGVI